MIDVPANAPVRRSVLFIVGTLGLLAVAVPAWWLFQGTIQAHRPAALFLEGVALAAWIAAFRLFAREAARSAGASDESRRIRDDLEAQLHAQTRDVRESNARLRSIIDSAVDSIVVIDSQGLIEAFNPAAERLFGYTEAEVLGRNVNLLMPSPVREEHDGYLRNYLTTGQARIIGIGREVTALRRDGTRLPVHLSVGEMTIGSERKFTGILHDLSARVRMEEQLREQTALARLGEMAAVIAHEVKNPLAGIRGAIQIIGGRLAPEDRDAAMIKEILARIDALNDLMKDLLLFARPPSPRPMRVDLVPLVAGTAHLLTQDPALRDVEVEVVGTAPPVEADPEMLKIAFQNLLVNSAQAMKGRGRIQVEVRADDGACEVVFADTGPGIAPEIQEKIFTAFFTTKSRGSGLGLPTAKRLIEAHNGRIQVTCPPSGGTVVTVRLPAGGSARQEYGSGPILEETPRE